MSDRIGDTAEIIATRRAEDPDFDHYLKMCPEDPYGNFYVRCWDDPNYEPGSWIMSHLR